jgi:hypothetical protein
VVQAISLKRAALLIKLGAVLGGLLAAIPGLYFAVVLGTFGGGGGERLIGRIGIPLGILLVSGSVLVVFVGAGASLGRAVMRRLTGRQGKV